MQIAVIGLGTMGANLARNAARNGAEVIIFNRTTSKTDEFMQKYSSEGKFKAAHTISDLINAFSSTRAILIMVKAGQPVDDVIAELLPHLSPDDILIDGGNSFFHDSERRQKELEAKGLRFIGMGVSGGEEGALLGPSMMPGGNRQAYEHLKPLLTKMAASDGTSKGKCVSYMGPGGAGHFVKMVHNGIEYGDMQLIAEAYHLLSRICGLNNEQLAALFSEWNEKKDLQSFLIEITATIFKKKDTETGKNLIDLILDKAAQKGTGKWTTQTALDLGVMIPTITAAVDARIMSAHKDERIKASALTKDMKVALPKLKPPMIADALFLSKICSYAQGLAMIAKASSDYQWTIPLDEVCRIWKGGCIIRSTLLGAFEKAFRKEPDLKNLMTSEGIFKKFFSKQRKWRKVVSSGILAGVPLPAMSASLSYFDGYFHEKLPQNLTQAQRDLFGAHTFERTDKSGSFHEDWSR